MNTARIRFSPRILARLGEELNQSADQSILELIKNAYDADAHRCVVELIDVSKPGGTIRVTDDGDGMDQTGIANGWLVLGASGKSNRQPTTSGRLPAGSKGLGRLSALRMGTSVRLESIKKGESRRKNSLDIDWSVFDDAPTVEEVPLEIHSTKWTDGGHGTLVELRNLRAALRTEELKRLARAALLLTDPFGDNDAGFHVELHAPEFKAIEQLVQAKYFDDADYHLRVHLDQRGKARVRLLDWKGQLIAEATHAELRRGEQTPYMCPAATFDFWTFLLKGNRFIQGRQSGVGAIREWLGQFGGVHVYQDGIRVSPYGDPSDDWLQINLSRVRSPEERPSTNNSIGKIVVSSEGEYKLIQKTDRSGFIADETFSELKSFAQDALDWLAKWRLQNAEKRRTNERTETKVSAQAEKITVQTAIASLPVETRKKVEAAFDKYEKTRDREADSLRREVQLYRTLSTAGITAATFAHESQGNPLKVISLSISSLRNRVEKYVHAENRERLTGQLDKIATATKSMRTLGEATLGLIRSDKRRSGVVDIHNVIRRLVELMAPFWIGRETEIELSLASESPHLMGSEAAVESIIANFINNSLDAFRRDPTVQRKIRIETAVLDRTCQLTFSDSGPGIDLPLSEIWLPGVTSASDGTGLGLTIVRDTLADLGGTVTVNAKGPLGGATFSVVLPTLEN